MLKRIVTGALLIPVVVALVWYGPPALLTPIAAGVAVLALAEFFQLAEGSGLHAYRGWTVFVTLAIFASQYFMGQRRGIVVLNPSGANYFSRDLLFSLDVVLILFLLGMAILVLGTRRALQETLGSLGASAAALLFIALPFSYLVRLDEMGDQGRQLVLFTLALVWAGDIVAYFVGKGIGRTRMAPLLSPQKTWEGAAANLVASLAVGYVFARWMQLNAVNMLVIAVLANIAGQIGDLLESSYKRGAAVKDSGWLLPGHGGILDRVDALILAAPVVWVLFSCLGNR
jgi:phosphatidate cytidylyltransferase